MAAKLARLTHKIAIQLHLVIESCTICSLSIQTATPGTFGYTLIILFSDITVRHSADFCLVTRLKMNYLPNTGRIRATFLTVNPAKCLIRSEEIRPGCDNLLMMMMMTGENEAVDERCEEKTKILRQKPAFTG
jgi:hypothetical protein